MRYTTQGKTTWTESKPTLTKQAAYTTIFKNPTLFKVSLKALEASQAAYLPDLMGF
jgi:hypothetical protein